MAWDKLVRFCLLVAKEEHANKSTLELSLFYCVPCLLNSLGEKVLKTPNRVKSKTLTVNKEKRKT